MKRLLIITLLLLIIGSVAYGKEPYVETASFRFLRHDQLDGWTLGHFFMSGAIGVGCAKLRINPTASFFISWLVPVALEFYTDGWGNDIRPFHKHDEGIGWIDITAQLFGAIYASVSRDRVEAEDNNHSVRIKPADIGYRTYGISLGVEL